MAGWLDPFLPTQLQDFVTIRREAAPHVAAGTRLIIGPWTHADTIRFPDGTIPMTIGPRRWPRAFPGSIIICWSAARASLVAPVRIYVMGENVWRAEQEWPLARAKPTALYLGRAPAR
jgi:predicted acyl esterase